MHNGRPRLSNAGGRKDCERFFNRGTEGGRYMTIDQNLIAKIAAEVMARVQARQPETASGGAGIFQTVDEAVASARAAQNS